MGGFVTSPPLLEASGDEDDNGDADATNAKDDDASSSSVDEMST